MDTNASGAMLASAEFTAFDAATAAMATRPKQTEKSKALERELRPHRERSMSCESAKIQRTRPADMGEETALSCPIQ